MPNPLQPNLPLPLVSLVVPSMESQVLCVKGCLHAYSLNVTCFLFTEILNVRLKKIWVQDRKQSWIQTVFEQICWIMFLYRYIYVSQDKFSKFCYAYLQDMEIPQVLVWPHNQQLDMEVKVMDRPVGMLPSPAGDTRGPQCPRPKDTTHTEDRDICF